MAARYLRSSPPSIILISIDTLRADRLQPYGYQRQTSPNIAEFARNAAVFNTVIAESSWTLPSHVAMLSGLHPIKHGVNDIKAKIDAGTPLLADILKQAGYQTAAFVDGGYVRKAYGFARGFEHFHERKQGLASKIGPALKFLDQHQSDRPFFLFLHTYDVHCPYYPPEPYYSQFSSKDAQEIETKSRCGADFTTAGVTANQAQYLSDRYDGAVRMVDDVIGEFLKALAVRGLTERVIIAITSDHGEEFFEHGSIGHQGSLHLELLKIPLIISAPGIVPGHFTQPTGLIDITPTLLNIAGISSSLSFSGSSLLNILQNADSTQSDSAQADRLSGFSYLERKKRIFSLITGPWHFLSFPEEGRVGLFQIEHDPLEQHDLSAKNPEIVTSVKRDLERILLTVGESEGRSAQTGELKLNSSELEELKTLGYLQ